MHCELARTYSDLGGVFLVTLRVFGNCDESYCVQFPHHHLALSARAAPPTHKHPHPRHPAPVGTNNDPQLTLCPRPPACEWGAFPAYAVEPRRAWGQPPSPPPTPRRTCRGLSVVGLLPLPGSATHLSLIRKETRNSLRSSRRGGWEKKKKETLSLLCFLGVCFLAKKITPFVSAQKRQCGHLLLGADTVPTRLA